MSSSKRAILSAAVFAAVVLSVCVLVALAVAGPGRQAAKLNRAEPLQYAPNHVLVKLRPRRALAALVNAVAPQGFRLKRRLRGTDWVALEVPKGTTPKEAVRRLRGRPDVLTVTRDPIIRALAVQPNDPFCNPADWDKISWCFEDENIFLDECQNAINHQQWGVYQVEAPDGWVYQTGDSSVVIAVLDSGVDLDHPDLASKIWTNPGEIPDNGVDDDGNGYVDDVHGYDFCGDNVGDPATDDISSEDSNPDVFAGEDSYWVWDEEFEYPIMFVGDPSIGDAQDNDGDGLADSGVAHGTMVAGIAAAATNNSEGIAGIAWGCKIMPVRILDAEGIGYGSDGAQGIRYAADAGADIINCSWGAVPDPDDPEVAVLTDAIEYAYSKGCVIVAAAGNEAQDSGYDWGLDFPGSLPETISVGATDETDHRINWSNYAIDDQVLDVMAPGTFICTTWVYSAAAAQFYVWGEIPGIDAGVADYELGDGTSFSAPFVSGLAALMLSEAPLDQETVRQQIRSRAVDLLDPNNDSSNLPGYDVYSGYGRIVCDPRSGPTLTLITDADATVDGEFVTLSWRAPTRERLAGFRIWAVEGIGGTQRTVLNDLIPARNAVGNRFLLRLKYTTRRTTRYLIEPIAVTGRPWGRPAMVIPRRPSPFSGMPRP